MTADFLRLDGCSHTAAKYAVEHWHYSRALPAGKLVKIGVWEGGAFIGCILYSRGANARIGRPYGLAQIEVCELTRIALREHQTPVSRLVAISLKLLKRQCPDLRLVVSYADANQGHLGGVYQAGNWIYVGEVARGEVGIRLHGRLRHRRSIGSRYGRTEIAWLREHVDPYAKIVYGQPKYKYLYPLNATMREQIASLAKPYPKHADVV